MPGNSDVPDDFGSTGQAREWLASRVRPRLERLHECHVEWIGDAAANTAVLQSTPINVSSQDRDRQLSLIRQDILVVRGWALRKGLPHVPPPPKAFSDREEAQAAFSEWCAYLERTTLPPGDGESEDKLSTFLRELAAYENAVRNAREGEFFPVEGGHPLYDAVQSLGGLPGPEPLTTWLNLCNRSRRCRTVTGWRNRQKDILVTDIPRLRAWVESELRKYDVFLAHNSKDKQAVLFIAEQLKRRGIRPWLDTEQIPPGRWFQEFIQTAIREVKSGAVILGQHGVGNWQAVELRTFVSQCVERDIPVIPVLLPGVEAIPDKLLFLRELHCVKFVQRLDEKDALDQLARGIRAG